MGDAAPNAPAYIGNWLVEGDSGFEYLSLEPNGRCKSVSGENRGGAFLGVFCSYTTNGNVITINETWDNSGIPEALPEPAVLHYVPDKDVLQLSIQQHRTEFHRTTKTEWEVYESKRN
jgi:hypothetical protein